MKIVNKREIQSDLSLQAYKYQDSPWGNMAEVTQNNFLKMITGLRDWTVL